MKTQRFAALAAVVVLALAGGCKSKGGDKKDQPDSEPGGGGIGSLGMMSSLLSGKLDKPGPYDEPRMSPGLGAGDPRVAIVELNRPIVELRSYSIFGGVSGLPMRELIDRLRELERADNVTGILLRVGDVGSLSMAAAEELRAALLSLGPKPLYCHTDGVSTQAYYVMTACKSIGLAPTGLVAVTGVAAMPVHVKGLLDKLGVHADFVHVGAYKGAAEPLTLDQPSPQMTETLDAILDEEYGALVQGIVEGRKLSAADAQARIDTALFQDEAAVDAKLVDEIATYEAYRDEVSKGAWKLESATPPRPRGMDELMKVLGLSPVSRPSMPHVALVYATGNVVDGRGDGLLGARGEIASRTLSAALRSLAADDTVRAVVLRVDSGGGSALASEQIWQAVAELKKAKPVVVSMGRVAASGGYYIGCGATKIVAEPSTLTGSIGVVGGKLALDQALAGIGVRTFPRGRGKRALMMSTLGGWTDDERAAMLHMMEQVYDVFVSRVAAGRGKSADDVKKIAQGRVWTGAAALDNGLVDQLGGLDDALDAARELGKVDAGAELEVYPPSPTIMDYVKHYGGNVHAPFGMDTAVDALTRVAGPELAAVARATLLQVASFAKAPVQTVLVFPVALR